MLNFSTDKPFEIATVIYIGIIIILFITKPSFIFDNPKIYYKFGINQDEKHKTMMPLWLLFVLLAVIIYYTVAVYSSQS
jgi:hypothetical protein